MEIFFLYFPAIPLIPSLFPSQKSLRHSISVFFRTVLRMTRRKIGYMDTMFKFITPITAWGEGEGKDSYQNIDARALETGTEFLLQVHIRTVRSRGGE